MVVKYYFHALKRMLSPLLKRISLYYNQRKFTRTAMVIIVAFLGVYFIYSIHAATLATSQETENGTVEGKACIDHDSNASGGGIVTYGASNCGTSCGQSGTVESYAPIDSDPKVHVIHVSGMLISNQVWQSGNIYVVDSSIIVSNGVTLTIDPGTTVKYNTLDNGIKVDAGGILEVNGTSDSNVKFTSFKDDSAGGDTNGDGTSSAPAAQDYLSAIGMNGGTANVSHAVFKYGTFEIWDKNSGGNLLSSGSRLSVSDSSFTNSDRGIEQYSDEFISLKRNYFALNTSGNSGYYAISVTSDPDLTGIVLSGLNKNTFYGNCINVGVFATSSTVPIGTVWTVENSSGASLWSFGNGNNNLTVDGTLNIGNGVTLISLGNGAGSPSVSVNGAMHIGEGVVMKLNESGGIVVNTNGILTATGSSTDKIIFTSYKDDSLSGDTNGDSDASSPAVGNYTSAISMNGGTVDVSHAVIEYAGTAIENGTYGNTGANGSQINATGVNFEHDSVAALIRGDDQVKFEETSITHVVTGLAVGDSAIVSFRGSFSDISGKSIQACNWGDPNRPCLVDAAYTDWGSDAGPFAANPADNMVCGAVSVAPWVHNGSTFENDNLFNVQNCDGSNTPDKQLENAISGFQNRQGSYQLSCDSGLQDACDQIQRTLTCVQAAINLALFESPFPAPSGSDFASDGAKASSDLVKGSTTYIIGNETADATSTSTAKVTGGIGTVVGIFSSLSNAYSSC